MTPRNENLTVAEQVMARVPRSGLQAAEFEAKGLGALHIDCRDIVYTDALTRSALLRITWSSNREARAQMRVYRQAHAQVMARRASLRVVQAA
jgi:hypothetical protein